MGQGVQITQWRVQTAKQARPNPSSTSSLSLRKKNARALVQIGTPAYVLKNEILQHETCSLLNHDSNHIKNLI